jgi:hypothetical protein
MASNKDSLWPDTIGVKSFPKPVSILKRQAEILATITGGKVYGEVVQSLVATIDTAVYDFYLGVTGKAIRHKLLTIECGILSDYPTRIINHSAGDAVVQVHDEDKFNEQMRQILGSPITTDLVGKLSAFA